MKMIFFLFLIFLVSCSTVVKEERIQTFELSSRSVFQDPETIINEFVLLANAKQMEERLDEEALARLRTTIPDTSFITPKHLDELHQQIKERSSNKKILQQQSSPASVDRRSCDTPVVSQCGGTCTSHAIANAMDNLICKPNIQNTSNEDVWNSYKEYSTWSGIQAAAKFKFCEESQWPNCGRITSACSSNRHVGLKSYQYLGNDIQAIKSSLDAGYPAVYSGKVTRSWLNCDAVINPNSSTTSGGHAVSISGYQENDNVPGGGYIILKNSWGKNCGDQGFQYMPFNYLTRTDGGMYGFVHSIKEVHSKYNDGTVEPVEPSPEKPVVCRTVRTCKRGAKCLWAWNCVCGPWTQVCE